MRREEGCDARVDSDHYTDSEASHHSERRVFRRESDEDSEGQKGAS